VRTPRAPLTRDRRQALFRRWNGVPGELFLGAAPLRGDQCQCAVRGPAGSSWTMFLGFGDARGPRGSTLAVDLDSLHGVFDAQSFASRELTLPATLPSGTWLWGRALVSGALSPPVGVAVQDAP
jgi:hypothetical protein